MDRDTNAHHQRLNECVQMMRGWDLRFPEKDRSTDSEACFPCVRSSFRRTDIEARFFAGAG